MVKISIVNPLNPLLSICLHLQTITRPLGSAWLILHWPLPGSTFPPLPQVRCSLPLRQTPWFSNYRSWTSSSSSICRLARSKKMLGPHGRPTESETLGAASSNLWWSKPSRWLWCALTLKNLCNQESSCYWSSHLYVSVSPSLWPALDPKRSI